MGKHKELDIVAQDKVNGRIAMDIADMHQSAVAVMYDIDEVWERQERASVAMPKGKEYRDNE